MDLGLKAPFFDLSTLLFPSVLNHLIPLPLKEPEYFRLYCYGSFSPFKFLFTHDHMELMVYGYDEPPLPTSLPCALPLFDALRVLVLDDINPSFLAGHTFCKLKRCRMVTTRNFFGDPPKETEMPACTRIDIDDPYLLATLRLPWVYELALNFSHPDCSKIWERHIAVNVNLSGLNLLHMKNWLADGDLIIILKSLPLLNTLIICSWLGVASFRAFLPMGANKTSGLKQTSDEEQTLALLCPRLQRIEIEVDSSPVQPELMPILKDIVTLRSEYGSPLKRFTFAQIRSILEYDNFAIELIGEDGSFTMENIIPDEEFYQKLYEMLYEMLCEKPDETVDGFELAI